jgi:SET domain-containing protein
MSKDSLLDRKPTTSKYIEIRNSEIHGSGIFASRDIPKDTWIIRYVGEKLTKQESNRRGLEMEKKAKETGGGAVYLFILDDEYDIDGNFEWNSARLINHSCDPNCETQIWEQAKKDDEIWYVSLRDIEEGEELSFNYGFDLDCWEDHPCRCGSKNCIGFIVAEEYWPKLKKEIAKKKAKKEKKDSKKKKKKEKDKKKKEK